MENVQKKLTELECVINCKDNYYIWWDACSWCISKIVKNKKGDEVRKDLSWFKTIGEAFAKLIEFKIVDGLKTDELNSLTDRFSQIEKIYKKEIKRFDRTVER